MKMYFVFFAATLVFIGCDVRRNDRIADDALVKQEKQKKQQQEKINSALKDTTTVQLIDSVFDFGTVKDGEEVTRSFSFKNTGPKPLVIMTAQATCGCTVPEKPEEPIRPGETGTIKVVFHSKDRVGHQEKTIRVTSNARPEFGLLLLKGVVEKVK
jgi:Protein of unknown function (DUF1573)